MWQSRLPALVIAASLVISGPAVAQNLPTVPIQCADEEGLTRMLREYRELAMLTMTSTRIQGQKQRELTAVLFTNPDTGTWTLVEEHGPNRYCAVAMGDGIRPFLPSSGK